MIHWADALSNDRDGQGLFLFLLFAFLWMPFFFIAFDQHIKSCVLFHSKISDGSGTVNGVFICNLWTWSCIAFVKLWGIMQPDEAISKLCT